MSDRRYPIGIQNVKKFWSFLWKCKERLFLIG